MDSRLSNPVKFAFQLIVDIVTQIFESSSWENYPDIIPDGLYLTGCEVYNLGTGKGTSVLEMVAAFEKAAGKVLLFLMLYLIIFYLKPYFSLSEISGLLILSVKS